MMVGKLADDERNLVPVQEFMHYECRVRSAVGSVGHQKGLCICFRRPRDEHTMDDPEHLSAREAAIAAAYFLWGREFQRTSRSN